MAANKDPGTLSGVSCAGLLVGGLLVWVGYLTDVPLLALIGLPLLALGGIMHKLGARKKGQPMVPHGRAEETALASGWRPTTAAEMHSSWGVDCEAIPGGPRHWSEALRGRSHKRTVHLFRAPSPTGTQTWASIRLPHPLPPFSATSDGESTVRVQGSAPASVKQMLSRWGARNMLQMHGRGQMLFVQLPVSPQDSLMALASSPLPRLVQATTLLAAADAAPQSLPPAAAAAPVEEPPASPAAPPALDPAPTPGPGKPAAPTARVPQPVADASESPVHQGLLAPANERPALAPAAPDPVAADLTPATLEWKPLEWTPLALGPHPSEGWKPREWTPPTYGWHPPDGPTPTPDKE